MRSLIFSVALLAGPAFGAIDPALTTCAGPCTITEVSSPIVWRDYEKTTISDTAELASLSSSLSASFAGAQSLEAIPFEINMDFPEPSIIETAPGEFITIDCCDDYEATCLILNAEGTTCGAKHTSEITIARFETWNAWYAAVAPVNGEKNPIEGNKCETETLTLAFANFPGTKTYLPVFVAQVRPTPVSPEPPVSIAAPAEGPTAPPQQTGNPQMQSEAPAPPSSAAPAVAPEASPQASNAETSNQTPVAGGESGGTGGQGGGSPGGGQVEQTSPVAGAAPPETSSANASVPPPAENDATRLSAGMALAMAAGVVVGMVIVVM